MKINEHKLAPKKCVTPGVAIEYAAKSIMGQKNMQKSPNEDQENRRYVQNKIKQYIEQGMQQKEIVEKILNDSIMEKFEYLTRNGLDIKLCVTDWVQSAVKRQNVKTEKER